MVNQLSAKAQRNFGDKNMAAIQIDGVDATLVFPDPDVEKTIELSLSAGAVLTQNYTASIQTPFEGATTSAEASKESWEE